MRLLKSIYDVILDRSPEEVVGAMGVALALSMVLSGVFALLRRKVEDRVLLVTILAMLACVASMGVGAGYVSMAKARVAPPTGSGADWVPGRMGHRPWPTPRAMIKADVDLDGRISPTEAAKAAEQFIASLTPKDPKSVDFSTLTEALALAREMQPPGMGPELHHTNLDVKVADWLHLSADQDKDRRLTLDEASAFLRTADVNDDGVLDPGELRQIMQALAPRPGPPSDSMIPHNSDRITPHVDAPAGVGGRPSRTQAWPTRSTEP